MACQIPCRAPARPTVRRAYEPGRIEAIGYDDGRRVARAVRETAGPAAAVRLSADKRVAVADGAGVVILHAEVVDARGRPVPTADNLLRFAAGRGATIIGVGNGNLTSLEPDRATERRAFNGLARAIVRTGDRAEAADLSVTSHGLRGDRVRVAMLPPRHI